MTIYNTRTAFLNDIIEDEQFDLVYLGHLSYIDTCAMTYLTRRYWINKIKRMIVANQPTSIDNMVGALG